MLKARRKEQIDEQLKFPEPREGLPEDPRPFIGAQHLIAAAAVQEQLNARCLVAVVGRLGSGKSTVCRRAANSRWARQWYLRDENGQPVHRRFWVDLEDCDTGSETRQRIAHVLGRPTFESAVERIGNGTPCLLILDNADQAFRAPDDRDILETLVAKVDQGASIIVSRRQVEDLSLSRPWNDVVEVTGFGTDDEAKQLFDHLAPQHGADLRSTAIVASCDRLPLAVGLLGSIAAGADLEAARLLTGPGVATQNGLDFALAVANAMLDSDQRQLWAALSLFPSGLSEDDIDSILATPDARNDAIHLFLAGILHRCEAGVRVPAPLRIAPATTGLHDSAVADLWGNYVSRATGLLGPITAALGRDGAGDTGRRGADRSGRGARRERPPRMNRLEAEVAEAWLVRQVATLHRLAALPRLPPGAFDLGGAGLLVHRSGPGPDSLDQVLARLVERSLSSLPDRDVPAGDGTGSTDAAAGSMGVAGSSGKGAPLAGHQIAAPAAQLVALLEDQRRFGTAVIIAGALTDAHRRAGELPLEAEALCQQGRAERLWTRYDDAETHLAEAHHLYEKLDDGVGQGCALFELGQVALDRGFLDDAETYLDEALQMFVVTGRPVGEANTNLELVRADLARGRVDSAERRLSDALDRYEQAGDRLGFANACLQLGQVELARGRLGSAERRFTGALNGYEQAADKVGFANACLQLGQVELARGRLPTAERHFGAALAGYELVGDQVGLANAALQLGQIDLARGRLAQAGPRLEQALVAYQQLGDRIGVANSYLQLGQVALGLGELDDADRRLSAARCAYDDVGDVTGSANSRHVGAMLRQAQGRRIEALTLFGEAARLHAEVGRSAAAAWSYAGAARACTGKAERMGYAADAVRLLHEAGQPEVAAKLAADLQEPPSQPVPPPEVKRQSWPRPIPIPEPVPMSRTGPEPGPRRPPGRGHAARAAVRPVRRGRGQGGGVGHRTRNRTRARTHQPGRGLVAGGGIAARRRHRGGAAQRHRRSPAGRTGGATLDLPQRHGRRCQAGAATGPDRGPGAHRQGRAAARSAGEPGVLSWADPQPAPPANPASLSWADPQPAPPANPASLSWADPQPAPPANPASLSGADPQPETVPPTDPRHSDIPYPDLAWSAKWSDAFKAIEQAPLGEWPETWQPDPPAEIDNRDVRPWSEPHPVEPEPDDWGPDEPAAARDAPSTSRWSEKVVEVLGWDGRLEGGDPQPSFERPPQAPSGWEPDDTETADGIAAAADTAPAADTGPAGDTTDDELTLFDPDVLPRTPKSRLPWGRRKRK